MPYSRLITATVMTFGVCQGHLSIASFCVLTRVSRSLCYSRASCFNTDNFGNMAYISYMCLHMNCQVHMACKFVILIVLLKLKDFSRSQVV